MSDNAIKTPRTPRPWTVTHWLDLENDNDPLGVYCIEPVHERLTDLYRQLDPELAENFDDDVHGENKTVARFVERACNNHEALVDALLALLPHAVSVLSGTSAGEELLRQARDTLAAVRRPP